MFVVMCFFCRFVIMGIGWVLSGMLMGVMLLFEVVDF